MTNTTARFTSTGLPWRFLIPTSSIGVIYGYDVGSSAAASQTLPADLGLTKTEFATINSVLGVGLLVGALCGGYLANRIGRRRTLVAVAVIFAVFAVCAAAAPNLVVLDICRFMLGVGIGLSTVAAPIFIGEVSPAAHRGGLIAMYQISNAVGIIAAYLIGYLVSPFANWRLIFALGAVPAVVVLIMLMRLPDTPTWYVLRGDPERAVAVLRSLGYREDGAREVVANLSRTEVVRAEGKLGRGEALRLLLRPPYRRALLFVVGFGALAKLTGVNALVYYQPLIFADMGFKGTAGVLLLPGLITVFSALATLAAVLLVDRVGRKPLLVVGLTLMALGDVVIAVIFAVGTESTPLLIVGLAGFALFQAGFGMSFGALIWVYSAESLPGRLRAVGATIALSSDFLINVVIAQFFLAVLSAIGGTSTFLCFAAMAVVSIVFCGVLAPETRGRDLDEVKVYWENGGRWPTGDRESKGASSFDK